jgi:hypothetical protein
LKLNKGAIVSDPAHLIDVLPTLSAITGSPIPDQWPGRELRPVSGVSLLPVFDGGRLNREQPLHFLFSQDRALRDGDWKAVSFRREEWELYHLGDDRTELNNLATKETERLERMVRQWTEMTQTVLRAQPGSYAPATTASLPHRHPEWTRFDGQPAGRKKAGKGRSVGPAIRARKNTRLQIVEQRLELEFIGDDPGIAMDLRSRGLSEGPYRLVFRLSGGGAGGGEIFYTTDARTTLPRGHKVPFDVVADGEWQSLEIPVPTTGRMHQLRIDVSPGPGRAVIEGLKLLGETGQTLVAWPEAR